MKIKELKRSKVYFKSDGLLIECMADSNDELKFSNQPDNKRNYQTDNYH